MVFSIVGVVAGEDVRIDGIRTAAEALRQFREFQATGQVSALRVYDGQRQISFDDLKVLAGERKQ